MPEYLLKELSCKKSKDELFTAQLLSLGEGNRDILRVQSSTDGGQSWSKLSLNIDFFSKIKLIPYQNWPPEKIDILGLKDDQLFLEYRDPWIPFEQSVLPFNWDKESLWRASYSILTSRWNIQRVKVLDYDNSDNPPL